MPRPASHLAPMPSDHPDFRSKSARLRCQPPRTNNCGTFKQPPSVAATSRPKPGNPFLQPPTKGTPPPKKKKKNHTEGCHTHEANPEPNTKHTETEPPIISHCPPPHPGPTATPNLLPCPNPTSSFCQNTRDSPSLPPNVQTWSIFPKHPSKDVTAQVKSQSVSHRAPITYQPPRPTTTSNPRISQSYHMKSISSYLSFAHMNITHTTEQHAENQPHWKTILDIAPFVSITFPAIMCLIFDEDSFEESPFLRFITLLLPFSYSAVQYALLYTNWKSHNKPEPILHTTLYYTLSLLLLAFTIISILSIIPFSLNEWDHAASFFYPIVLPSFTVPPAYLLSSSYFLVPRQIRLTDTVISILISVCSIVNVLLVFKEFNYYPYSAIISSISVLLQLLSEKHCLFKQSPPSTASSRAAVLILTLILAVLVYTFLGYGAIYILDDHFHLLGKMKSILPSEPHQ
ncbi:hypothetical protein [Encephalitozoon cuniculi GB-M1]|uniref:UPF0328 protein ECU05_0030 n=3 Tax=Encephalitozoon cuniculi (strain GB-M1) TaxID=284813 RepID=Y503_ENCCU|nr:uncharacterized protein ECU05_0030 [Encephalitozoon cuniculi GB-M1]P0CS96.1 RecName: Full=UPF0328 protein ECU05_0030 [Encephalitozoon cuniculi GB-M1]CAD26520.2 hypothetical protein [Encephalitozoon cuniculi GB-M1]